MISKWFNELSNTEIYEILKARATIFVKEQNITYVDEDDVDYDSLHIFRIEDGRVIAYLRAYREDDDTVKVGRVLTIEHGKGIGTELMMFAIEEIPKKLPCKQISMDAQKHAINFYERLGFSVTSEEYLEEGIIHVDMSLKIS